MAHLTPSVVRLLSHAEPEVQLTALKALTNLMLDADSAKVGHITLAEDVRQLWLAQLSLYCEDSP